MRVPVLGTIDERFWVHRQRSTSIGGLAAIVLTAAMFFYQLFTTHVIRWDFFAIIATAAVVKMTLMIYYRMND